MLEKLLSEVKWDYVCLSFKKSTLLSYYFQNNEIHQFYVYTVMSLLPSCSSVTSTTGMTADMSVSPEVPLFPDAFSLLSSTLTTTDVIPLESSFSNISYQ